MCRIPQRPLQLAGHPNFVLKFPNICEEIVERCGVAQRGIDSILMAIWLRTQDSCRKLNQYSDIFIVPPS